MLRAYTDSDLEAVTHVWYEASKIAHSFLSEEFFAFEREQMASTWMPNAESIVFEVDGRIEGFLSLVGNEVGAIFVHPGRPYLELEVFQANSIGGRFYRRYGFEEVGRGNEELTGQPALRLRFTCPG